MLVLKQTPLTASEQHKLNCYTLLCSAYNELNRVIEINEDLELTNKAILEREILKIILSKPKVYDTLKDK